MLRPPAWTALLPFAAALGCGPVPDDPGARLFPARGVIRGTVVYQGPPPCSQAGHVVGAAVILVFDLHDPPPPDGLAASPVNFTDVTGDVLFAGEPRFTGAGESCPARAAPGDAVTSSAAFEVSPIDRGGSYELRAFYDATGHFLPQLSIGDQPELGDVAGGDFEPAGDLAAGASSDPDVTPAPAPVVVGVAAPGSDAGPAIPPSGFVADNVTVTIATPVTTARPYFHPQGEAVAFDADAGALSTSIVQSSDAPAADGRGIAGALEADPSAMPVLTIPQDAPALAPPSDDSEASAAYYEAAMPHLVLSWGVPASELAAATAPPFDLPLAPAGQPGQGFSVWQAATRDAASGARAPESVPGGSAPLLWPRVLLSRMAADGSTASGAGPRVVMLTTTMLAGVGGDSLAGTERAAAAGALSTGSGPGARPVVFGQDHLAVVVRPAVLCLPAGGGPGVFVAPHLTSTSADVDCSSGACVPAGAEGRPLFSADPTASPALAPLVTGPPVAGCLPAGRYAISVVYPDGQSWTVPNEAGVCSPDEGAPRAGATACSLQPRPVLASQGARAFVEVVAPADASTCAASPVPAPCLSSP